MLRWIRSIIHLTRGCKEANPAWDIPAIMHAIFSNGKSECIAALYLQTWQRHYEHFKLLWDMHNAFKLRNCAFV